MSDNRILRDIFYLILLFSKIIFYIKMCIVQIDKSVSFLDLIKNDPQSLLGNILNFGFFTKYSLKGFRENFNLLIGR